MSMLTNTKRVILPIKLHHTTRENLNELSSITSTMICPEYFTKFPYFLFIPKSKFALLPGEF